MSNHMEVREIIKSAQKDIKKATGFNVTLVMHYNLPGKGPRGLMRVIADALEMDISDFSKKSRRRDYVQLRFVAIYFIKQYFPATSYSQIGHLVGLGCHTSVLHAISQCYVYLETEDAIFMEYFSRAQPAVEKWIKS